MKLSQKLRLLREEKGITQQVLADKLGIGIQSIRNYENDSLDRIPNTVQLKMLKDFYNVTYEYLLDEECENKTNTSIDIGKKLKLSDKAIEQIINLQTYTDFTNNSKQEDKEPPLAFNTWLENFSSLKTFTLYINDYHILKDLLVCSKYFSTILELKRFFTECLNNNIKELDCIFKILDEKLKIYERFVIHGDTSSKLDNNSYKELEKYIKKLKKYCVSYNKEITTSYDELFDILNEITEIGAESFQYTYKDLQFCQYQITELIRDNLHEILGQNNELPSEYKKIINTMKKEGK